MKQRQMQGSRVRSKASHGLRVRSSGFGVRERTTPASPQAPPCDGTSTCSVSKSSHHCSPASSAAILGHHSVRHFVFLVSHLTTTASPRAPPCTPPPHSMRSPPQPSPPNQPAHYSSPCGEFVRCVPGQTSTCQCVARRPLRKRLRIQIDHPDESADRQT